MGIISDIGKAFEDVKITTETNSNSATKIAEYDRDAKIYSEKQQTIRNVIWSIFFSHSLNAKILF